MSTAEARRGNTPIGAPDDAALPGVVLLQQPRRLVEVLSPLLTGWLGPRTRLACIARPRGWQQSVATLLQLSAQRAD